MLLSSATSNRRKYAAGFTLAELLVSLLIFAMVSSGVIYGYVQANRMAQWSAISLAAQSYASQGAEQVRAANWNPYGYPMTSNAPGTFDELPAPFYTNYHGTDFILDVPAKGSPESGDFPFFVTNYISITDVYTNDNPHLREIRSDAVWQFYLTGKIYTNTAILLRTSDQ